MKQPYNHGLPPCPMSAHCLRLLDDLDTPSKSQQLEELTFTNDVEDERLVEQLRTHVPKCPTCSFTLAQARRTRAQQRRLLSHILRDSEQKVPSTASHIFAAIRLEQRTPLANNHNNNHRREMLSLIGELEGRRQPGEQTSSQRRSRTILRNAVALVAVAAIILAAIGIFNRENFMHVLTGNKPTPTPKETAITNWGSVVIGLASASIGAGQMTIMNYDPKSGRSTSLVTSNLPANTQIEGVSRDGHNLLYRLSQSGHTFYYTLTSVSNTGFFYELSDSNAGHAIWEPDNTHVLIATVNDGVVEVNIQNGASKKLLPALNGVIPTFYSSGYMYFIGGQTGNPAWLYRANTTNGLVQPISQLHSIGAEYLLSPLGSTIYFANKFGPAGQPGLYSVKIDGTNLQPLRAYPDATPIGFAADNSLEFMRQVNGKFQVWKLGATPQQDSVVLADAVPGASSLCNASVNPGIAPICEQNIALSPYGRGMVVHAFYTDGSSKLLFDDLTTGQVQTLQLLPPNTQVQLSGWDQLAVPGSSPSATATPGPSQNYGGWNSVAIGVPNTSNPDLWSVTNNDYLNGQSNVLVTNNLHQPQFDGISPDGTNLLYQVSSSDHVLYFTLQSVPKTGYFYELNAGNAENAIWMSQGSPDVLIATINSGVLEVNTQTGKSQTLLPALKTDGIRFYRNGYLYFIGAEDRAQGALYRINIASGVVQQVTFRSLGATYWLSPDGSTVYFANKIGPAGEPGIYAVNSDGSNSYLLRQYTGGTPIGYAADGSLVIMRVQQSRFEVVKLGANPQKDVVLLADAAPGAVSLCDSTNTTTDQVCDPNIALAPYGHALIVQATYPDGSLKVWSDDLITGKKFVLETPTKDHPVQLIGWDRLAA